MRDFINYLLALPLAGFGGTIYFGHQEDRSDAVASCGYDARNRTLDVHYVRGRSCYRYFGVSILVVIKLMAAKSLGVALNHLVRWNRFPYTTLTFRTHADEKRTAAKYIARNLTGSGRQKVKARKRVNKLLRLS